MDRTAANYTFSWIHQIAEIPKSAWDPLAQPLTSPFFEWDWLHNLESSGSATGKAGWMPCHLTVWRDRTLVAAAPLYLKGHSYGEFVFDHQFADLSQRLGVSYYPKLLGMSPFTPAEGYRFLIAPDEDEAELLGLMVAEIDHFCDRNQISSCHFLYVDPSWQSRLQESGFSPWRHHNYIWHNDSYGSFDEYLKAFNANQRRNIKRERKAMAKSGLTLKTLTGDDIPRALFPLMYRFYENTCDKFGWWGSKYLTKRFFEQLYATYRHRVLFVGAYPDSSSGDERHPVGMSFCLTKGDRLYGRYWGSHDEINCLHFNVCYYSPIEWAIDHNIQIFDPGAGGRHKKRRGFPATPNVSLHRFYPSRLRKIILPYLQQVNEMEEREVAAINQELPFARKEN
ncbi:N-acetyltransferase [Geitlerinema sp. P-1104]|uniref:GNAT family N-acetyltransferase n=1 Tax=Geitlerinema sp. P-1104 TaxID=2546230 RepID=UPI0014777E3F|nr:GNAT family N-acetyltransferase [Geitlerinema sp. P-1104]NMG57563.1 N-acetyltransferase [Geitlerinema sp. P-1104]